MKLLLLTALAAAAPASPQATSPVTSDAGYVGPANMPSASADGRFIAYQTPGTTPGDTCIDVHVRDVLTGAIHVLAGCSSLGGPAISSYHPAITGDGTLVAYERSIPAVGAQIHLQQATGSLPVVVSVNDAGVLGDSQSLWPSVSFDGAHVAFQSQARNFVVPPLLSTNVWNVYVRHRGVAATALCSPSFGTAVPSADGSSQYPAVSASGRFVAFQSSAGDLVAAGLDTNGASDVFVRDRDPDGNGSLDEGNGVTTLITANSAGVAVSSGGLAPAISADGRFVTFLSYASDFAGIPGNRFQVYVCDRDPDANGDLYDVPPSFEHVSRSNLGSAANLSCFHPSISADGRYVAFSSFASTLMPNPNGRAQGYLFDRAIGQLQLVSADSYGSRGNDHSLGGWYSDDPVVTGDGTYVVFSSRATNLVPGDLNGYEDIFRHEICPPVAVDLGSALAGTGGLHPTLSACGDLASGGTATLRLREALPGALMAFFGSPTSFPTPVFGGTLVPVPPTIITPPLPTDALGGADLPLVGGGGPFMFYAQALIVDPTAAAGVAFSNAVELRFQP